MHNSAPFLAALTVVVLVALVPVVSAKGPTVKLTVSGGHLRGPTEVTSQPALVDVWGERFIGAASGPPRHELPRYQVAFHVQPTGRSETRVVYVVTYAFDPISGHAFIYLPGRGEKHHALNVGTILREERDGRWHRAVPAWAEALNRSLPR